MDKRLLFSAILAAGIGATEAQAQKVEAPAFPDPVQLSWMVLTQFTSRMLRPKNGSLTAMLMAPRQVWVTRVWLLPSFLTRQRMFLMVLLPCSTILLMILTVERFLPTVLMRMAVILM